MACEPFHCTECVEQYHDRCKGHSIYCDDCEWSGGNTDVTEPCIKCGGPCSRHACHKWPTKGFPVCSNHGANAPQVVAAAERRKLDAEVHKLLGRAGHIEPVENPYVFLAEIAGEMNWVRGVLAERVGELESLEDVGSDKVATQIHVLMAEYSKFVAMCGRIATDMSRLDLDSRNAALMAKVDEATANIVSTALTDALGQAHLEPDVIASITRAFGNALRGNAPDRSQTPAAILP